MSQLCERGQEHRAHSVMPLPYTIVIGQLSYYVPFLRLLNINSYTVVGAFSAVISRQPHSNIGEIHVVIFLAFKVTVVLDSHNDSLHPFRSGFSVYWGRN